MSLVGYGTSSESDDEWESVQPNYVIQSTNTASTNNLATNLNSDSISTSGQSQLFTSLPQPKSHNFDAIVEEESGLLLKRGTPNLVGSVKPKTRIKIEIPSVSKYVGSDDDKPAGKKLRLQTSVEKTSGLFLLLPPPKVKPATINKTFIPHILQKNANKSVPNKYAKKNKPNNKKQCKVELKKSAQSEIFTELEECESDDGLDAFPEGFDDETWQKVCGKPTAFLKKQVTNNVIANEPISVPAVNLAPEAVKPYSGLSNQAFKDLVGSSKRKTDKVALPDVHEDEIRPDRGEWLKSLTDPNYPAKEKELTDDPVHETSKRQHHITYLARQAKENEQELQNLWSQSRFNRKQTQAKYGF